MKSFDGKTAFITGGASGIGLALAKELLRRNANVAIADIEQQSLEGALAELDAIRKGSLALICDVSERQSLHDCAQRTISNFGPVHLLFNNAGVSRAGPIEKIKEDDWNWVIDVNLKGVINGLSAFLDHMKDHDQDSHIVNSSSIYGLVGRALAGPYCATKFAIVGLTEVLVAELDGSNIGASVLCPFWVKTRMVDNGRNRQTRFGGPIDLTQDKENGARNKAYLQAMEQGLSPDEIALRVLKAIELNQLYIITHEETRSLIERRADHVNAGFASATRAPSLSAELSAAGERGR